MQDLKPIEKMLKGKSVALVGNSQKVIDKSFPVDDHDVVIRMNGAWNLPSKMQLSVGSKLDILCISAHKKEIAEIASRVPNVVWMSPKSREVIDEKTRERIFFYPVDWWQELYEKLGARPSTGCMAVDMIAKIIGDGQLTLYGFDFFANPSWHKRYTIKERIKLFFGKEIYVNPHDGAKEFEFIQQCLPQTQLSIVKP